MTLYFDNDSECAVCGESSTQPGLLSTNATGSSDLDGRPSEMVRSTMDCWIERCPGCGYCSTDIGESKSGLEKIIQTPEYRDILERDDIPELAASFLASSYLYNLDKEYARAARMAHYASWVLDDFDASVESTNARIKTIALIQLADEHGQEFSASREESILITVDLMRRSRLFNQAEAFIENTSPECSDDSIQELIRYERQLIADRDSAVHTLFQATSGGFKE